MDLFSLKGLLACHITLPNQQIVELFCKIKLKRLIYKKSSFLFPGSFILQASDSFLL